MWPDTFEDWYTSLGVSRADYLDGYEREWSISLASALVSSGIDVHLVYVTRGGALTGVQRPSGATAHFVPETAALRLLRRLAWHERYWERTQHLWAAAPFLSTVSVRLLRELLSVRADAIVIQDYETPRFDIAAPLLRLFGARVLALDTGASSRPSTAPWKRWTRNRAHRLLAVHEQEAARLRALGHDRVDVWPVPVRTDVFSPGDRTVARNELAIAADERVVFSATRLHPVKNLPLLADACRDVGATLVLTGDGPERSALEKRRQPGLHLVGWQTPEQLRNWYAAADVVALSSNQEGQPTAVLEAFACSRAVVATAVGGVPEVVKPDRTGWLVPPRNRAALAEALRDALADRNRTDRLGAAGRALVLERYAAPAVAAAIEEWALKAHQ